MNPGQARVARPLLVAGQRPWLTMPEIAARTGVPPRQVRHMIWTMVRRGWAEKSEGSHKGAPYRLTPRGAKVLAELRRDYAERKATTAARSRRKSAAWLDRHHASQHASPVRTRKVDPEVIRRAIRTGEAV